MRGARSNFIFVAEDYIDLQLRSHWCEYNHVTHVCKYNKKKRIRNKYKNKYEAKRCFINKLLDLII